MQRKTLVAASLALAVVALMTPHRLDAAPLIGTLTLSGQVSLSAATIDWLPPAGGTGSVTVTAATGDFTAPDTGTAKDLNSAAQPVGVPFFLPDFLTLAGQPDTFDLTFISPGVFSSAQCGLAPAAGQVCTPFAGSPFNFENLTATSSRARFTVLGLATDPVAGDTGQFTAVYEMLFASLPYQDLLSVVAAGGSVSTTYSADFVVGDGAQPVPEPASAMLVLAGITGWVMGRRRCRFRRL